jgi:SAM-dependent methyltransferase
MSAAAATSYDVVPYGSLPYYASHPDALATVAVLNGVPVASPAKCRVLEIGCAEGGNLLPMALQLPESRFVGVDLSPRQIADGDAVRRELGADNLELRAMSLADIDASFGSFDYILCHGVFSWVPAFLQDKILEICRDRLAPNGVAMISYNVLPGWHVRMPLRDLMLRHARRFADPGERTRHGRAILEFLAEAMPNKDASLVQHYRKEIEALRDETDEYLFHEYLETENRPCYFTDFAERAGSFGLQYLSESIRPPRLIDIEPEHRANFEALCPDRIEWHQLHDFLSMRTFRRSVLCRVTAPVDLRMNVERVMQLHAGAQARPVSAEPDLFSDRPETFRLERGDQLATDKPLIKIVLSLLAKAWPRDVPAETLWNDARALLREHGMLTPELDAQGRDKFAEILVTSHQNHILSLHICPFRLEPTAGPRPRAFGLARFQARRGDRQLSNLRHQYVRMDDLHRLIVAQLDGETDRDGILAGLTQAALDGRLTIRRDDQTVTDRAAIVEVLSEALEPALRRLAAGSLLEFST